jgi:hypothetical protein
VIIDYGTGGGELFPFSDRSLIPLEAIVQDFFLTHVLSLVDKRPIDRDVGE